MYNLLVSGGARTWDEPHFVLEEGRFLEHTTDAVANRLRALSDAVIDELCQIPAIFSYEGIQDQQARVGWIEAIRLRQGTIRIKFKFDPSIAPISNEALMKHSWEFDINKFELSRTHWAVKDVDLHAALIESGLGSISGTQPDSFKFSRKTIIAAASALKGLGHSDFDRMMLELGVEGLHAGRDIGNLQNRANAVAEFALKIPSALTSEGTPIQVAIIRRAAAWSNYDPESGQYGLADFWAALKNDGYTVSGETIVPVAVPATSPPPYAQAWRMSGEKQEEPEAKPPPNPTNEIMGRVEMPESIFKIPTTAIQADLVSIMMPFAGFNGVHEAIKKACAVVPLQCLRADDIWEHSTIIQDIFSLIYRSRIVVVDLTGKNPNVFYETGIAHTLGRQVVPITQSNEDVPFDLRHHRFIHYHNNSEGLAKLTIELAARLKTLSRDAR